MSTNKTIKLFLKEKPELKKAKRGFPNIGKRADLKKFSNGVRQIEEAWGYYDIDLYKIKNNNTEITNLGNGNPIKYKPFKPAINNLKKRLKQNLYEYSAAAGDETDRQILANYLIKEGYNKELNFNNIIITDSTTAAFYLILKSIFKPYDVIIMTSPNYGLFTFMPERININVELIPLEKEDDYKINPQKLKKKITEINKKLSKKYHNNNYIPRVKAILNTNPHNPLGTVISADNINLLNELGKVCQEENVFVIDDLIYRDLTYENKKLAKPLGTIDTYFDISISLFGLSKSYGLAKTRSGFIVANEVLIRAFRDNLFYIMDSASSLQSSLLAGTFNNSKKRYKEYKKYFNKLIEKYKFNCYLTIAMFEGIDTIKDTKYYQKVLRKMKENIKDQDKLKYAKEGIPYAKIVTLPESGFFILVDFTKLKEYSIINSEKELLNYLYINCGVKFLIGQSFAWPNKDEIIIRISYSLDVKKLIDAYLKINIAIREALNETNRSNHICK